MYQIKKIKVKDGAITMQYTYVPKTDGVPEYHEMTCRERACDEFYDAMNAFKEHVVNILELPDTYKEGLDIIGLTFADGAEEETYMITGLKKIAVANSPFVINTPLSEPSRDAADAIEEMRYEAERYLSGDRAQMGLFNEGKQSFKDQVVEDVVEAMGTMEGVDDVSISVNGSKPVSVTQAAKTIQKRRGRPRNPAYGNA